MHAVVIRVTITNEESAQTTLQNEVVPRVAQLPGFVAGYWTRKDNTGMSMVVFDSEDDANTAAERIPQGIPDDVNLEGVEVREVVANA